MTCHAPLRCHFSCSFLLSKHLPCQIRFRSTCSSSGRQSRCRRLCIPPCQPIQNLSVQGASARALRRQRCACIYSDKSQLLSKATNRRVDSQLARVSFVPFPLVLRRRRPCYALNLWNMDSARSITRGKCVRIPTSPWASLV